MVVESPSSPRTVQLVVMLPSVAERPSDCCICRASTCKRTADLRGLLMIVDFLCMVAKYQLYCIGCVEPAHPLFPISSVQCNHYITPCSLWVLQPVYGRDWPRLQVPWVSNKQFHVHSMQPLPCSCSIKQPLLQHPTNHASLHKLL